MGGGRSQRDEHADRRAFAFYRAAKIAYDRRSYVSALYLNENLLRFPVLFVQKRYHAVNTAIRALFPFVPPVVASKIRKVKIRSDRWIS